MSLSKSVVNNRLTMLLATCTLSLSGCDSATNLYNDVFNSKNAKKDGQVVTPKVVRLESPPTEIAQVRDSEGVQVEIAAAYRSHEAAIDGTAEIPYPLYPNANQYRIGGQNGLKIVLFETDDSFQDVDAYYKRYVENEGYSRLLAMEDYVRYSTTDQDFDAWAVDKPGIVIHEFENLDDALKLGATGKSQTNIIMSF